MALPFAAERTERLATSLRQLGYDCRVHVNPPSGLIDGEMRDVIASTEPDDVVIVHVLAHADPEIGGSLTVVGSDGYAAHDPVESWVSQANRASRGRLLFLVDLAAALPVAGFTDREVRNRFGWVIGAVTKQARLHGHLTGALADLLDELSRGAFGSGLTTGHLPLPVVVQEVQRRMSLLDNTGASIPDRLIVTATGNVADEEFPFFPVMRPARTEPPPREPFRGERANSVAVTEVDGETRFAVATTNGIVLCDVDGVPVRHAINHAQYSVAAIPGMNAILCGGADGTVTIRSLPELSVRAGMDAHDTHVLNVAAATLRDRTLGASAHSDGRVRVWELPTMKVLHVLDMEGGFGYALAFSTASDAQPLLMCGTSDGRLVAWNLDTFEQTWRIPLTSAIHGLAAGFALDRPVLLGVHDNGSMIIVDQETGRLVTKATLNADDILPSVALVDGRTAVVGGSSSRIDLVDLHTAEIRPLIDLDAGVVWSLALYESAQGPAIVAATDDGVRTVPLGPAPTPPTPRGYAGYVPDVETGVDRLGITGEVHTLCDLVLAREITPPLSIGLFGDWGTGKSFFMEQMRDRVGRLTEASQSAGLEGRESALCSQVCQIKFNAWHYIDVDLWASLAATIFDKLAEADASTVSRKVLQDLPSVRKAHEDLLRRQQETSELLKATNKELEAKTPIRVSDVLTTDTVRKVAGEAASKVDEALEKAGVPKGKVTELNLREVASTAGTVWQNLRFVFQRTGWLLRLMVFLGVVVVVAGPPVIGILLKDQLGLLPATVGSYVVFGVGALLVGKPYLNRAARAIGAVKDLVTSVDDRRRAPVEARRETLRHRMVEIDQELQGLNAQLKALHRGTSISAFALERTESDNYRSHEGMVATLRRDLEEMSRRLTATAENGQSADLERIILYVDDLDRCPPRRVVELLQAIHLLLAFPLFVVVVGVDSRWLLRSLDTFLRENGGDDPRTASTPQNYLEKIFQITQCLRPMSPTGYADLISANIGLIEQETRTRPAEAPRAEVAPVADVMPQQGTPVETAEPAVRRPEPPPVAAKEIRTYRDRGKILHLRFVPASTTLESVDSTGVLTRRSLIGTDSREDRVVLVGETIVCALPVSHNRLLVIGASAAVLADRDGAERRPIRAANGKVRGAVVSPQSNRVFLQTDPPAWYAKDLTDDAETKLTTDVEPLALSGSWTVERTGGSDAVARNETTGFTITVSVRSVSITACIDPAERWLAYSDESGLHLRDLANPTNSVEIPLARTATFMEFGPHNLIATSDHSKVSIWDCETGKQRAEVPAEGEITAIAFSPDGGRLATGNADGRIRTWVIHDRKPAYDLSASALRLTEAERSMIIAVRPFIETPRSAKRLINTYRLLRAALTEADLAELRENGHRPVLLLLSVLLGEPEEATGLVRDLLGDRQLPPSFTALAGHRSTRDRHGLEAKIAGIIDAAGVTNDTAAYRRWARVVARYSFRTLDL